VISNHQDLHQHLEIIFGLVVARGVHLETSTCSKRGIAAWHGVYAAAGTAVSQACLRGHNPNQALLMAQMNHNLNQGMVQMCAFMPTESKRQQTCIQSAIMSAHARLATSKAQGRNTAMIEQ
jgi:hypothetical protein